MAAGIEQEILLLDQLSLQNEAVLEDKGRLRRLADGLRDGRGQQQQGDGATHGSSREGGGRSFHCDGCLETLQGGMGESGGGDAETASATGVFQASRERQRPGTCFML